VLFQSVAQGGYPQGADAAADLAALLRRDVMACVASMAAERLPALLVEVAALQSQLAAVSNALGARLLADGVADSTPRPGGVEHLLDVQEAATRLGMSTDWLYRHARQLPFTRRVGRRAVKFDPTGLARWVAAQRRG
jgi:predicted DNA-binding transcriptional regulator AlpA